MIIMPIIKTWKVLSIVCIRLKNSTADALSEDSMDTSALGDSKMVVYKMPG